MEYFGYLQIGHNPEYVDGSQSRIIWTMSIMQCKMITSQNNSGLCQACNLLWIESPLQNLDYVTPCIFWIMSYFSLNKLSDVFDCFWLLFWSRSCLKSSGRLLGSISTKFRANPRSYDQKSHVKQNDKNI